MTEGYTKRLPSRPSDLIRLALKDLATLAKDPKYAIGMNHWHFPSDEETCVVCLAGSVMAVTLGMSRDRWTTPRVYRRGIARKLLAIDHFRKGHVFVGLREMGLRAPLDISIPPFMTVPAYGEPGFTEAMEAMAAGLRRANL